MKGDNPVRIAMWSGPRNISTAMMRSFGNRDDTFVCDEPLYAHYLDATGFDHPGAEEIIAKGEADWRRVAAWLTGEIPDHKTIFYQKHMAHHLLAEIDRFWLSDLTHAFLIRDPREMLTSLVKILPEPRLEDTGLPQQLELFRWARRESDSIPPVLDSKDVLEDPGGLLQALCSKLDLEFQESMLSWPPGRRETDGIWAPYWYSSVEKTTSFQPYRAKSDEVPKKLEPVYEKCCELYDELAQYRMVAAPRS